MTWFLDYIIPCIKKSQWRNGQKAASSPFPRITKNYRTITLTPIAVKVYNALLLNHIQPEVEKIIRKNQDEF